MADGEGEETLEGLRAEVVRVRDETLVQLRQAEGERDGAQARVTELEAASASTAGGVGGGRGGGAGGAGASASAAGGRGAVGAGVHALKVAGAPVPSCAGERQEADLSGMTAAEKI